MINTISDSLLTNLEVTIITGGWTRPMIVSPSVRPRRGASGSTGRCEGLRRDAGSKQERVPPLKMLLEEFQDPGNAQVMTHV